MQICQMLGESYHLTTLFDCQDCGIKDCPIHHIFLKNSSLEDRVGVLEKKVAELLKLWEEQMK